MAIGASLTAPALAQPPVPGTLPSREQVEQPTRPDPAQRGDRVQVRDQTRPAEPCPFTDSPLTVELHTLRFVGVDGMPLPDPVAEIVSAVRPQAGPQPVASLCALRDAAAARLDAAGYIAAVQIPPQEINAGEAVLEVVLARLVDVRVQGDPGRFRGTLDARIARLRALTPLNRFAAERILLLAGDVPGLDVALTLRSAGTVPGEVIGDLTVRYEPWAVVASATNTGSRQIGRESGTIRAEAYGLTGLSDRTFIGGSSTGDPEEQRVVFGGHSMGDARGNTLSLSGTYAWSRPDVGQLDLRARSMLLAAELATPLVRRVNTNLVLSGGLEAIDQEVVLQAGNFELPVTRDRLRVGFVRMSGGIRAPRLAGGDAYAVNGTLEVRHGFDLPGVTERGVIEPDGAAQSRFDGDSTALVVRGTANGFLSLTSRFGLSAAVAAQWAENPLLSFEEYGVGSLTIGRGYDPGVTGGDRAFAFRIEPTWRLPISARSAAQFFAFYDQATIWNLDEFATEDDRTLRSWGFGVRGAIGGRLFVEAMYASPESKALSFDQRPPTGRVLLSVTVSLGPSDL